MMMTNKKKRDARQLAKRLEQEKIKIGDNL